MLKFSIKNLIENISDSDPVINAGDNSISMSSVQMHSGVSQLPLTFNANQMKFQPISNSSDLAKQQQQQQNSKLVDKLNINKSILNQNTFSRPSYSSSNGNHHNTKKKNFKQQSTSEAFHHMSNNQRKPGISKSCNNTNIFTDRKADISFTPFDKNNQHADYRNNLYSNNLNEAYLFNQQQHQHQQQQQQQLSPPIQMQQHIQQAFPFLNNSQLLSQLSPANLYQQYHLLLSYVSKMPNLVELNHGPSAAAAALAAAQLMTSQQQQHQQHKQQQQQQPNKMLDWPFQHMHSSASPSPLSTSSTSSSSSCSSSSSSTSSSASSSFIPITSHNQTNNNPYSNQSSHHHNHHHQQQQQQQQQFSALSNETLNNYLLDRLSHQYLAKNQEILLFKNKHKVNDVMLNGSVSDSKHTSFIKNSNGRCFKLFAYFFLLNNKFSIKKI